MCWKSTTLEKKIATKDIKTFKVGYKRINKLYSYYRGFIYDFNRPYVTVIHPEFIYIEESYKINQGFHSYNPKKCCYRKYYGKIGGVVQSKITEKLIDVIPDNASAFECTIPKGAEYFENEDGEIVSNQIIIKSVLEN